VQAKPVEQGKVNSRVKACNMTWTEDGMKNSAKSGLQMDEHKDDQIIKMSHS